LDCEFVTVAAPTRECVTVIDESAGTITELVEESAAVDPAAFDTLLGLVGKRMPGGGALVMSGTIASGGPMDLYARCTRMARKANALSIVDASGRALLEALEANPGLVKPNRAELGTTMGSALQDENAVRTAMSALHARGAQCVVVTAGPEPTLAFDGQRFWRVTSPQVPALNPIGSGDAFTAGLAWKLVQGADLAEACRWAAAAGAANGLTPMAGEVNRDDVERLVNGVKVERL
jgi:tagatose 6-phosphate kinase